MTASFETSICDVIERGGVTFAELERVDGFSGDLALCLLENPSVILWEGVSELATTTMAELLHDQLIKWRPCAPWIYLVDGKSLLLPICKRSDHFYKSPRWLPVVWDLHHGGAK